MPTPYVEIQVGPDVERAFAGAIIGRSDLATLSIAHPAVSEAHLMVSLRGGRLHLLPLRGRTVYNGVPLPDVGVVLAVGQEFLLAGQVPLKIVGLQPLHAEVWVIVDDGVSRREWPLRERVHALDPGGELRAEAGGILEFWLSGGAWSARRGNAEPEPVGDGTRWTLAGLDVHIEERPVADDGVAVTVRRSLVGGASRPRIQALPGGGFRLDDGQGRHVHVTAARERELIRLLVDAGSNGLPVVQLARPWNVPREGDDGLARAVAAFHATRCRMAGRLRKAGMVDDLFVKSGRGRWALGWSA